MPPLFQCISLKKFETKRMDVNICDEHFTVLQTIIIGTQTVTWKYYVKANIKSNREYPLESEHNICLQLPISHFHFP